ncbi:MAG: hypothetical protein C0404_00725 [Verrucomicrobia bacterium]|nr:hypothetical protein [Verrucomicrobiota bacterium]
MKSSLDSPQDRVKAMLQNLVVQPSQPIIAPESVAGAKHRPGHHSHDSWELFAVCAGSMNFEVAGRNLLTIPGGGLLLVPPDCVHMRIEKVNKRKHLFLLVIDLPSDDIPNGGATCGEIERPRDILMLSAEARATWSTLLGEDPDSMITRAAAALAAGGWSAMRGAALVRLVISAFGEAAANMAEEAPARRGEHRIRAADAILRKRFYDPTLSLRGVAKEVELSATHLATRFKALTGQTFWKTLLEIRLRRARALLESGRHSVKEVAALTGWSNQLYFSAAFRRKFDIPPSAIREKQTGPPAC